jgi:hypothetical protein
VRRRRREAGIDALTAGAGEITEEYRAIVAGIKCIRIGEGVWGDVKLMSIRAPGHAPPERELELRQRTHSDHVDVLGVESGIFE